MTKRPKETRWAIWWLDQASCEVVEGTRFLEMLPRYIQSAFTARSGRAGRGRLWPGLSIAPDMTDTAEMKFW